MADEADKAFELSEYYFQRALQKTLTSRSIPFSGLCLACGDKIEKGRYCDSHCRDNHEKWLRRNR